MSERFKVGQKVHVEFDGEVVSDNQLSSLGVASLDNGFARVKQHNGNIHAIWEYGDAITVKPQEFVHGDIYRGALGTHYKRISGGWRAFSGSTYNDGQINTEGFIHLVPESA